MNAEPQVRKSEQVLTFILANQEYGVDILRVQEIKGWEGATRIPRTPSHVLGVMNLRGAIVPIVDLRRRFGMETVTWGRTSVVVLVRVETARTTRTVGLVVDAVSDVHSLEGASLAPPPEMGSAIDVSYIRALATVDSKLVVLLHIDRLLGEEEAVLAAAS